MHMTLYRKWRPNVFTDVYGQDHITSVLKYEVANNKINHAYLFCGSRGTGKTTCAKILSAAVNCEAPQNGDPCGKCPNCLSVRSGKATDILEMDAASNTGVDYIRDIRDSVIYLPAELKYKVYIIDEVHMLSDSAFNALLKTLEEPPERVIFILATTEPHKIPTTILSRCQRFDFRRIPSDVIVKRLMQIAEAEKIELTEDGARLIAVLSEGGMRDSISLLELASAYGAANADNVSRAAGIGGRTAVAEMVKAIADADTAAIFNGIDRLSYTASDIAVFWQELISFYRDMIVVKTLADPERFIGTTSEGMAQIKECAACFTKEKLIRHARMLDETFSELRRGDSKKQVTAEMALLRMTLPELDDSYSALLQRISELENIIKSGRFSAPAQNIEAKEAPPVPERTAATEKPALPAEEIKAEIPEKAEEIKEAVPKEKKPSAEDTAKTSAITNWGNVIDKIGRPMIAIYLTETKAEYDSASDTVTIRCEDSNKANFISDPEATEEIKKALAATNAVYADSRIKVVCGKAGDPDPMDAFIV